MALKKKQVKDEVQDKDQGKFEEEEVTQETQEETKAEAKAEAPAKEENMDMVVSTKKAGAVAVGKAPVMTNVLEGLKDAIHVEYDTVPNLKVSQGSFSNSDDDEDLGGWISLSLISFQGLWVCSPNDLDADDSLVVYSNDGEVSDDGINLKEHLAYLKEEGYDGASITERVVLVGELTATAEGNGPVGDLVQISLPPTGRRSFNTFQIQSSWKVKKGELTEEEAHQIKLTAQKAKSRRTGAIYTKVVASLAK